MNRSDASPFVVRRSLAERLPAAGETARRRLQAVVFEVTARCNLDCRHCYVNRPADDRAARKVEPTAAEILAAAGQAAAAGALEAVLTGGEPLLRDDFEEIYRGLKSLGLLVTIFTNATGVSARRLDLLRRYPPWQVEVTLYGATAATYETVTRRPGSYAAMRRGIERLTDAGLPVVVKAMAMQANREEFDAIAALAGRWGTAPFRFDPFLHLRTDRDPVRNREIAAQRLTPAQVVDLERRFPVRWQALADACGRLPAAGEAPAAPFLLDCGAGRHSVTLGADGRWRLCAALVHPGMTADARSTDLATFWRTRVPAIRRTPWPGAAADTACRSCRLRPVCIWCPAHAHLETGALDRPAPYFCETARARFQQATTPAATRA